MKNSILSSNQNNIRLMLYDEPDKNTCMLYLLGLSPIQILMSFPKNCKIKELKLVASKSQHYIYPDDIKQKDTITQLVKYFNKNNEYTIDDLTAILDDNTQIFAHDDCEMTIIMSKIDKNEKILYNILTNQKYNANSVFERLKELQKQYVIFKQPDILTSQYSTFDEYLNRNNE